MPAKDHRGGGTQVTVEMLISELTPAVEWLLAQIQPTEFTTNEFIAFMESVPRVKEAYDKALSDWGEGERQSKMVIHGQVIPSILRHSAKVEWVGYAHDQADAYAVPAWWRIVE